MTNRFMISVAALALIAGTGLANAQGANRESGGAAGGSSMQHSAPADSTAGSKSETSEPKGGMKSGQTEKSPGAMKNDRAEDSVKGGSTREHAEDRAKGTDTKGTDTKQRAEDNQKSGTTKAEGRDRDNMKAEGRDRDNMKAESRERDNNMKAEGRQDKSGTNAAESKSTTERSQTTGQ